jgi:hypothetical protein
MTKTSKPISFEVYSTESIDAAAVRISSTMRVSIHQVGTLLRDGWTEAEIELAHRFWCTTCSWPNLKALRKVYGKPNLNGCED